MRERSAGWIQGFWFGSLLGDLQKNGREIAIFWEEIWSSTLACWVWKSFGTKRNFIWDSSQIILEIWEIWCWILVTLHLFNTPRNNIHQVRQAHGYSACFSSLLILFSRGYGSSMPFCVYRLLSFLVYLKSTTLPDNLNLSDPKSVTTNHIPLTLAPDKVWALELSVVVSPALAWGTWRQDQSSQCKYGPD